MKNIFKMMGIALLACSMMMVSCGKDDDTDNNNTNNGGNNGGNNNTEQSYKITFNSETWEPGKVLFLDYTDYSYMSIIAFYDEADYNNYMQVAQAYGSQYGPYGCEKPYVAGTMMAATGEYDYQSSEGDKMSFRDARYTYTLTDTLVIGTDTIEPGDYLRYNAMSNTFTENITAIDLNALTMTATWSEDCFDFEEAYVTNHGQSAGTLYPLTGVFTNYKWAWYE